MNTRNEKSPRKNVSKTFVIIFSSSEHTYRKRPQLLLVSQSGEQKTDLAFHFARIAHDAFNLLPHQLAIPPPQAMYRRPYRSLAQLQAPGHLVVRSVVLISRQEHLQPVELRRVAFVAVFLAQARQHPIQNCDGPPPRRSSGGAPTPDPELR